MPREIFINYRRDDEPGMAALLYSELEKTFSPDRIFMDVEDGISPGHDFVRVLEEQVAQCNIMLAMIGKGWLSAADDEGRRRLDNPEDFVRIEIESAIRLGKLVIPVLLNKTEMPRARELPDSIKSFARCHAVWFTQQRFRVDAQGIVKAIQQELSKEEERREREAAEEERLAAAMRGVAEEVVRNRDGRVE